MSCPSTRPALPSLLALTLALATAASAHAAVGAQAAGAQNAGSGSGQQTGKPDASATVEQCLTAPITSERSATFVGEMSATPSTARMEISIGLLERAPGEGPYRAVSAPGLGAWRGSAPGVKSYTYIKQVTDLSAPAFYRGSVRFRWLNAKGHIIKTEEMRTPRCEQPGPLATSGGEPPATGTTPANSGTSTTPADG